MSKQEPVFYSPPWHPDIERVAVSPNTGAINHVEMECIHIGRSTIQRVKKPE